MKTEEAIEKFLANRRSRGLRTETLKWYKSRLRRFDIMYPEVPLVPEPIETFLESSKNTQETRHADYRALRAFYRFISNRFEVPNPMDDIAAPRRLNKVMATVEAYELTLLLDATTNARDRALLTLLIDTGARAAEVATLRRQDIKSEYICVAGKTGERIIPISEETRRLLISLGDPSREYIFEGERGPLTRSGIYRIVRHCMNKAGILGQKRGPHRLRHTFGRFYLVAGGDVRSLQLIMGHANIATTERYSSLTLADTISKHRKFTPLQVAHAAAQESLFKPGHSEMESINVLHI